MSASSFFDFMSDFWSDYEQQDLFKQLWIAYSRSLYTTQLKLFQDDFGKSLDYIRVNTQYYYLKFNFDDDTKIADTTYSSEDNTIVSIPALRDGISKYNVEYTEGTDYTMSGSDIVWFSAPDEEVLWAPITWKSENRIANNFGVMVQEELADSTEYLNAIKGMYYAYWYGPTLRNIRNGLNIFFGLPFAERAGIVHAIEDNSITIKHGYRDYTTYDLGDSTTHLSIGDNIERFDVLTGDIEVSDYISKAKWWDTYAIDMINEDFVGESLTDDARKAINNYSQYFTFGVKIDGERYSDLNIISPGIAVRFLNKIRPKYTNHLFIVNNNFRSIDPLDDKGEWLTFNDDDFLEEYVMKLHNTFMFNYINYVAYISGFADNEPLTFDQYQTQNHESYDLDTDVLGLYEILEIV